MSFELTLSSIFMRLVAMLAITGIHGFALAGIARLLGDKGPGYDGRLHAGPFGHLDVFGLVSAILAMWGWIRPMRIDAPELRGGRFGLVACVVLSLGAVVLVCQLALLLKTPVVTMLPPSASNQIVAFLNVLAPMSIVFAVVNLIPLPPFTGGHILAAISPRLFALAMSRVSWIALALAALAVLDRGALFATWLRPLVRMVAG